MSLERMRTPTKSELKQAMRNAQKRLDRVAGKWGENSSPYMGTVYDIKEKMGNFIDDNRDDYGRFKLNTRELDRQYESMTKSEKQQLYLNLNGTKENPGIVKGVLDIEYETQEMLKDPFAREKIADSLGISSEELASNIKDYSENEEIVNQAQAISHDFKKAIETYRELNYTAEELGGDIAKTLKKGSKTYEELIKVGVEIWNKLAEKNFEKNELAKVGEEHDKAQEDYLKNRPKMHF